MSPPPAHDRIDQPTFARTLARYPALLPPALRALDAQRQHAIPATLAQRRRAGDAHLTRSEVLTLVDWKLAHGTFRPRLRGLVAANEDVEEVTREAFAEVADEEADADWWAAMKVLMRLAGVGPATASLLLATYSPERAVFFGDEVYRWVMFGEAERGKGTGWRRGIGYTVKEYRELVERVGSTRERLGTGAREVEMVAWVLGREAAAAGGGGGDAKSGGKAAAVERGSAAAKAKRTRKEVEEDGAGTGTRRSKRVKALGAASG